MKRKRFIKLIMGLELSRNEAAACAKTAREEHGSYAAGADAFARVLLEMCRDVAEELLPAVTAEMEKLQPATGGGKE